MSTKTKLNLNDVAELCDRFLVFLPGDYTYIENTDLGYKASTTEVAYGQLTGIGRSKTFKSAIQGLYFLGFNKSHSFEIESQDDKSVDLTLSV